MDCEGLEGVVIEWFGRVRFMIKAGILEAEKFGRDWQIDGESVESRKKAMEQKKREP